MEQPRLQVNSGESSISLAVLDVLSAEARRASDLLTGAVALLRSDPSSGLCQLVSQARVSAVAIMDAIERAVAVEHEKQRNEHQRLHAQAAKSVGGGQ